ncbi:MAG: alpha/beta fold hydrolase [Actinomycetota bacterium]|nr:alpha/beta fold hydrolase [Actinomycetota bacterium]
MTESLTLNSAEGLRLEAEVTTPDDPRAALVLCHPHPKMGGTMDAPLLVALSDALVDAGFSVLRFNFRGIGESEGNTSEGLDEIADAEAAVKEMKRRHSSLPTVLVGWSFGGAVAVRTATRVDVSACVAIAPAVKRRPGVTAGLPPADELALDVPSLFVCGVNDDVISPAECRGYAEALDGATYKEIRGANHFFWAKYDDLAEAVVGWLKNVV